MPTEVWVALIGGVVTLICGGFTIVVAKINRSAKQNAADHGDVSRTLGRIEGKLDTHLGDHRAHN